MKTTILFYLSIITGNLMTNAQSPSFEGKFAGQQPGISSAADMKVSGDHLTGSFEINGRPGIFNGTINGQQCQGVLFDIQMQKNYSFTASVRSDSLHMSIIFPEFNNQVISLKMRRLAVESFTPGDNRVPASKNNSLLGLWRYTETFNSGSGDNYASFSTDYFMEFKDDGTVYSWKGKSAGGMGNISIEGSASPAEKANWYTQGKTLFLVDPATGSKKSLLFYAEPGRMMLHNGGQEKKILTRIR